MTQLSEAYRKIRNTFRFALGNLSDFDPARDSVAEDSLEEFDRWMLGRTSRLVANCLEFYEKFDFHRVYHAVHDFCVVDLSAFYFDILKDRLYTFAPKGCPRRSAQTAIYRIASTLARLLAPILAFTADEIWKYLPREEGAPADIHLAYSRAGAILQLPRRSAGSSLGALARSTRRGAEIAGASAQRQADQ